MYSPRRISGPRAFLKGARSTHFVSDVTLFVDAIAAMANAIEASAAIMRFLWTCTILLVEGRQ